jgi:hypothetical protein
LMLGLIPNMPNAYVSLLPAPPSPRGRARRGSPGCSAGVAALQAPH